MTNTYLQPDTIHTSRINTETGQRENVDMSFEEYREDRATELEQFQSVALSITFNDVTSLKQFCDDIENTEELSKRGFVFNYAEQHSTGVFFGHFSLDKSHVNTTFSEIGNTIEEDKACTEFGVFLKDKYNAYSSTISYVEGEYSLEKSVKLIREYGCNDTNGDRIFMMPS